MATLFSLFHRLFASSNLQLSSFFSAAVLSLRFDMSSKSRVSSLLSQNSADVTVKPPSSRQERRTIPEASPSVSVPMESKEHMNGMMERMETKVHRKKAPNFSETDLQRLCEAFDLVQPHLTEDWNGVAETFNKSLQPPLQRTAAQLQTKWKSLAKSASFGTTGMGQKEWTAPLLQKVRNLEEKVNANCGHTISLWDETHMKDVTHGGSTVSNHKRGGEEENEEQEEEYGDVYTIVSHIVKHKPCHCDWA